MKALVVQLPDDVIEKLEGLAARFEKSIPDTLEHLILDRASVSDQHENDLRRERSWKSYSKEHLFNRPRPLGDRRIFMAGYNRGWIEFQIRHNQGDFVIPAPEVSSVPSLEADDKMSQIQLNLEWIKVNIAEILDVLDADPVDLKSGE